MKLKESRKERRNRSLAEAREARRNNSRFIRRERARLEQLRGGK